MPAFTVFPFNTTSILLLSLKEISILLLGLDPIRHPTVPAFRPRGILCCPKVAGFIQSSIVKLSPASQSKELSSDIFKSGETTAEKS